ncbi:MAG: SDR family oxidoreductase [Deltaproteobacteria bacterium]|nr:MAG: SDR family oxidoreductase [Deltaproteobacteria bacterium]
MAEIRFDGKVAIVTGAGGGLGRSHALLLASRGAKVVVNDLGGAADGTGAGKTMAEQVCKEIKDAGGEAVPDYNSVLDGDKIVKTAVDSFGTVDILINNAGILRDISFMKQTDQDWKLVLDVHLNGSRNVTKAAFPVMREKGYGRIIMTTSGAGLYGNFGQTNYSAAKLGIVGLANTLKAEGAKYNVKVNTIAPIAGSRLTAQVMPQNLVDALKPEYVSPLVAYLCSEQCEDTGMIFSVGGGYFSRVAYVEGEGVFLGAEKVSTIEDIQANIDKIKDLSKAAEFTQVMEQSGKILKLMKIM